MVHNEISVFVFNNDKQAPAPWQIQGSMHRIGHALDITFLLSGEVNQILLNDQRDGPAQRLDNLWQHTCFELFIAEPGQEKYWEYNVAANGHWNCYEFERYRHEQRPATTAAVTHTALLRQKEGITLQFQASLAPQLQHTKLQANLCCVIETREHIHYYHAAAHPGDRPDFHHRRGFILNVPAAAQAHDY